MLKKLLVAFIIAAGSALFASEPAISFHLVREEFLDRDSIKNVPSDCMVVGSFSSLRYGQRIFLIEKNPVFTEKDIKDKSLSQNWYGSSDINLVLTAEGAGKLAEATFNNIGKRMIGMVNGIVFINATITCQITGGNLTIANGDSYIYEIMFASDGKTEKPSSAFKELNLKEEPGRSNPRTAWELINTFFYYFCRGDEKYKDYIFPRYYEIFEELQAIYSGYDFEKIEVEYHNLRVNILNRIIAEVTRQTAKAEFKIRFYTKYGVYENSIALGFEGIGKPLKILYIPD